MLIRSLGASAPNTEAGTIVEASGQATAAAELLRNSLRVNVFVLLSLAFLILGAQFFNDR
jgi:hypothetical protein